MDRSIDRQTDGRTDRRMDGQTDRQTDANTCNLNPKMLQIGNETLVNMF